MNSPPRRAGPRARRAKAAAGPRNREKWPRTGIKPGNWLYSAPCPPKPEKLRRSHTANWFYSVWYPGHPRGRPPVAFPRPAAPKARLPGHFPWRGARSGGAAPVSALCRFCSRRPASFSAMAFKQEYEGRATVRATVCATVLGGGGGPSTSAWPTVTARSNGDRHGSKRDWNGWPPVPVTLATVPVTLAAASVTVGSRSDGWPGAGAGTPRPPRTVARTVARTARTVAPGCGRCSRDKT